MFTKYDPSGFMSGFLPSTDGLGYDIRVNGDAYLFSTAQSTDKYNDAYWLKHTREKLRQNC